MFRCSITILKLIINLETLPYYSKFQFNTYQPLESLRRLYIRASYTHSQLFFCDKLQSHDYHRAWYTECLIRQQNSSPSIQQQHKAFIIYNTNCDGSYSSHRALPSFMWGSRISLVYTVASKVIQRRHRGRYFRSKLAPLSNSLKQSHTTNVITLRYLPLLFGKAPPVAIRLMAVLSAVSEKREDDRYIYLTADLVAIRYSR